MKTEELIKAKKYIEHVIGTIKRDGCLGIIHTDWILPDLEKALAAIEGDECSSDTDELSVEKLQEHLLPYKKEMIQKIIDEKMQLVTADEFLKLHKESLTAIRENDKLQEQLKKFAEENEQLRNALEDIRTNTPIQELLNLPYGCACHEIASEALAAIGGDDDNY